VDQKDIFMRTSLKSILATKLLHRFKANRFPSITTNMGTIGTIGTGYSGTIGTGYSVPPKLY